MKRRPLALSALATLLLMGGLRADAQNWPDQSATGSTSCNAKRPARAVNGTVTGA